MSTAMLWQQAYIENWNCSCLWCLRRFLSLNSGLLLCWVFRHLADEKLVSHHLKCDCHGTWKYTCQMQLVNVHFITNVMNSQTMVHSAQHSARKVSGIMHENGKHFSSFPHFFTSVGYDINLQWHVGWPNVGHIFSHTRKCAMRSKRTFFLHIY